MIEISATYKQTENERWDAYTEESKNVYVKQASSLNEAKEILAILLNEEIKHICKTQDIKKIPQYKITQERIIYFNPETNKDNE